MAAEDAVLAELQRISSLIELAFKSQLDEARGAVREDAIDAAILDVAGPAWVGTTQLQEKVGGKTGKTGRAIRTHVTQLHDRGYLRRRGPDNKPEYRSAGIV